MYDYGDDSDDDEFDYNFNPNSNKQKAQETNKANFDMYDAEPVVQNQDYKNQNYKQQNDNDLQIEDNWDFNDHDDKQQPISMILIRHS